MSYAARLKQLHEGPEVLVLPNAWDLPSALLLADLPEVRAIGTTSAGLAAAAGRPDGEEVTLDQVLAVVAPITAALAIPVTVDLEAGYGAEPAQVSRSIAAVVAAGAAGVNLEDGSVGGPGLDAADRHAAKIAAAREAGGPLVLNARTDTYWRSTGEPGERFAETVRRLRAYRAAGADCLFVPGFPTPGLPADRQREAIRELVGELDGAPINLLARADLLPVGELAELGIRRLSMGSGLYRLGLAAVRSAMGELLRSGRPAALATADELPYPELAKLLGG